VRIASPISALRATSSKKEEEEIVTSKGQAGPFVDQQTAGNKNVPFTGQKQTITKHSKQFEFSRDEPSSQFYPSTKSGPKTVLPP
jgi:hypothetical protein